MSHAFFHLGEGIEAVQVRIGGGVDKVVGEVEMLDHLLEQVLGHHLSQCHH